SQLVVLRREVLERELPGELRTRRRAGEVDAPGDAPFGDGGPACELRCAGDGKPGDRKVQREGAIEERRDRLPVALSLRQLDQLRAGDRGGGIEARDDVALRLRAERGLDLVADAQLALEPEPVQPSDGDVLAAGVDRPRRV